MSQYYAEDRHRRMAARLFEHVRAKSTDQLDETFEYDLSIYADPAVAERERSQLFGRLPVMALHASEIAEPGSFKTVDLNRSSALVTRGKDGKVTALLNVCRHRGARLADGEGRGSKFTCPYHGWTYAADGTLMAVSFRESVGVSPCPARNLFRLPVEERHGFIWIVENPDADIDVAAHLGPGMDAAMAEYPFARFHHYKSEVFTFPQNWKVMIDGLIDGYHVPFLHQKTISPYFFPNMLAVEVHGEHALWGNPRRRISEIVDQPPGSVSLDRYVIFGNLLGPNSAIVMHPHHVEFWTVYQGATPDSCRLHLRYLTPKADHDARSHEILDKNWQIALGAIVNEDIPMGNSIQASAAMPHAGRAILGRNEVVNQVFHRSYKARMAG